MRNPNPPASSSADPGSSTLALLRSLLENLPHLISDRVHLLTLELRRAMQALALMVVLMIAAAVMLVTAWLALWVGLAAALIQAGLAWGWVLLLVLLLNGGAALAALMRARSMTHLLALPATKRRLTVAPAAAPVPAPGPAAAQAANGRAR